MHLLARPVGRVASAHARWQLGQFRSGLAQCRIVQDRFLERLLETNRCSDFGRQHGFGAIRSYADFAGAVPLTRYAYFEPYIERCKAGDTSALFGPSQRLAMFALTAGTTGKPKYIPVTSSFMASYRRGWNVWGVNALAAHPDAYLRRVLQIAGPVANERTSGGLPCGAISVALARHQKSIVRCFYAVPRAVAAVADPRARYYATARFALTQDVGSVVTANPSTLVRLAQFIDENAQRLIRDVQDGTLDPSLELEPALRNQLSRSFGSNRMRSRQLERLLDAHGCLLPKHYWDPALLAFWTGGTVGLYLPQVAHYYGHAPVRDIGLLATEGRLSIPLEDHTPAGVLDVSANFYEFIAEEELDVTQTNAGDAVVNVPARVSILRADELDKNGCYYVLLTNHAGLYRYHIGDVVRVTDFAGTTPVIEFLSRGTHTSSLTGEKLTEHQVVTAVGSVLAQRTTESTGFAMAPVWADPPYYALFMAETLTSSVGTIDRLALLIDGRLAELNRAYA
jgi:hypothetical protein